MTPANSAAVDGWSGSERPRPLASWYTEGLCDGIGDRLLMFDNSGTPSLELLRFRPLLTNAKGFEDAVRERVAALRGFDHRAFSRVRAVERLESGDLALVSTYTGGKRVAEIFWSPQARTGVHPAFAAWLIRELTAAVADLHRQGDHIAHAGLSPDRVILTPDGRLVIVEHVLGAALDRLQLPVDRLWQALGIVGIADENGRARLDQRTDVVQVAWIALSLLLGRRVSPFDYLYRIDNLLEEFVSASRGRAPNLVSSLKVWLERALHADGDVFESAVDAQNGLGDLRMHGGTHGIAFAASRMSVDQLAFQPPQQLPPMRPSPNDGALLAPIAEPAHIESQTPSAEIITMAMATELAAPTTDRSDHDDGPALHRAEAPRRTMSALTPWLVAAVFALVAISEALWIGMAPQRADLAAPTAVPVVFDSPSGDTVIVDGQAVGTTPLTLAVTPAIRSIRLQTHAAPAIPAQPTEPAVEPAATTGSTAAIALAAAARDKRGGFRLSSPVELQVLEGEHVLGSSADGPIVTTVGRHELDFINSAVGYRSRQVVEIRAGQIVPMRVVPPDGKISMNAVPWAQVWIDGNPVGETPLANLPLAVGEHDITFRHPQLGEQMQKVLVKSNALTRVSATFSR